MALQEADDGVRERQVEPRETADDRTRRMPWRVLEPDPSYRARKDDEPREIHRTVYHARRLVVRSEVLGEVLELLEGSDYAAEVVSGPDARGVFSVIEVADLSTDRPRGGVDAWDLRGWLLRNGIGEGTEGPTVALDHLVQLTPYYGVPYYGVPYYGVPYYGVPYYGVSGGGGDPSASYAAPGTGGRTPVAMRGPDLPPPDERGPVVAVLDTGLGQHPWFAPATATGVDAGTGIINPRTGLLGPAVGHGTFVAGIVRQRCPAARIAPYGVMDASGLVEEQVLHEQLADLAAAASPPDVINLSLGFYPEDATEAQPIDEAIRACVDAGIIVVAAAGNDAEDREMWPARGASAAVAGLNPSGRTTALFSNEGQWIRYSRDGANLVSSLPAQMQGASTASVHSPTAGGPRSTLDLDDFGSGFGVWSGTSFAAPVLAGEIACVLAAGGQREALADLRDALRSLGPIADAPSDEVQNLRDRIAEVHHEVLSALDGGPR